MEIRITLTGEFKNYYKEVKEYYGISSNTELLRLMTIRFYNYIQEEKAKGKDKMKL